MWRLNDPVTRPIHALALPLGVGAQEEEDHAATLGVDTVDHGIGEALPATVGVGAGLAGPYGEHGVEEEYALAGPGPKVSVLGDGMAGIVMQLAEHVAERRGRRDAGPNGEGQAVGLPGLVIGVLAEEDGADSPAAGEPQGIEDFERGRVDVPGPVLADQEALELAEVRPVALVVERGPGAGDGGQAGGRALRSYGRPLWRRLARPQRRARAASWAAAPPRPGPRR